MNKRIRHMAILGVGAVCVFNNAALAMEHADMADGAMSEQAVAGATSGSGVLNAIDIAARSVNLSHDPIRALGWPAMTMDLPVTEQVDLSRLSSGEQVDFRIELGSDNVYRITHLSGER